MRFLNADIDLNDFDLGLSPFDFKSQNSMARRI